MYSGFVRCDENVVFMLFDMVAEVVVVVVIVLVLPPLKFWVLPVKLPALLRTKTKKLLKNKKRN